MTIAYSSPVTGTAVTGLTSPTYTIADGGQPESNAKSWYVTALGGTQTNVRVHAVSDPFTLSFWKPKSLRTLAPPNAITGRYGNIGNNEYSQVVRKGVNYASGQPPLTAMSRFIWTVPAGADSFDQPNLLALLSLGLGAAVQQANGIADAMKTGNI